MPQADGFGEDMAVARRALLASDWTGARGAFERAAAAGAGPGALEGLAQAAFMLNDPAVAIDARERAYAGYREAGQHVEAARIAIALSWDYRAYRGEPAVSDGWLARARRLLADGPPTAELGWL
ncbi:MAG TPA: hypothetical protein VFJ24_08735, partial [Gaiellales bacterium]|nr:hypothetical protein [Gaiellales bacterium]